MSIHPSVDIPVMPGRVRVAPVPGAVGPGGEGRDALVLVLAEQEVERRAVHAAVVHQAARAVPAAGERRRNRMCNSAE